LGELSIRVNSVAKIASTKVDCNQFANGIGPQLLRNSYPLVNVYKKLWKDPPFFMGKSTISMAIFNSYPLVI